MRPSRALLATENEAGNQQLEEEQKGRDACRRPCHTGNRAERRSVYRSSERVAADPDITCCWDRLPLDLLRTFW